MTNVLKTRENVRVSTVTAKVRLNQLVGEADEPKLLVFGPDYADSRNKQWAQATPHLDLRMTVTAKVARHFAPGESYTLTFTRSDAA